MAHVCGVIGTLTAMTLVWLAGCSGGGSSGGAANAPRRIVSLSPSITETLFALGAGDRVAAVTDFCAYPPAVKRLPRVGGYLDPNYEHLLALKPDLVILRREHAPVMKFLDANGIAYVSVDNDNVNAILDSFRRIGAACGVPERGDSLARAVQEQLRSDRSSSRPPSVLLCVGRSDMGSGRLAGVFAAGPGTYYRELLEAAGAVGVPDVPGALYPSLSVEAILRLAPNIIVDLAADIRASDTARVKADWGQLAGTPAVRQGMVFCLTGSYVTVPGPRITLLLQDLRSIVARWRAGQSGAGAGE